MAAVFGRLHSRYLANTHVFSGRWALNLEKSNALFAKLNNILHLAPMAKWALSIVPISLAITGAVPAEKIDIKQSAALGITGFVWTYYGFLLRKNNAGMGALMGVNAAMGCVHGLNFLRAWRYKKQQQQNQLPSKA